MSTSEGYHGGTMSTSGDTMSTSRGYHECIGGGDIMIHVGGSKLAKALHLY